MSFYATRSAFFLIFFSLKKYTFLFWVFLFFLATSSLGLPVLFSQEPPLSPGSDMVLPLSTDLFPPYAEIPLEEKGGGTQEELRLLNETSPEPRPPSTPNTSQPQKAVESPSSSVQIPTSSAPEKPPTVPRSIKESSGTAKIFSLGIGVGTSISALLSFPYFNMGFRFPYLTIFYDNSYTISLDLDVLLPPLSWKANEKLFVYLGIGVFFEYFFTPQKAYIQTTRLGLGVRAPLGLEFALHPRWDLILQGVLGIRFSPKLGLYTDLIIGTRYHF